MVNQIRMVDFNSLKLRFQKGKSFGFRWGQFFIIRMTYDYGINIHDPQLFFEEETRKADLIIHAKYIRSD